MPPSIQAEARVADNSTNTRGPLAEILDLVRKEIGGDFSKLGDVAIVREVERHMAQAGLADIARYLERLRDDEAELDSLSNDLLIKMTPLRRSMASVEKPHGTAIPTALQHSKVAAAQAYAESIVAAAKQPLAVLDEEMRVIFASPSFWAIFCAASGGALDSLPEILLPALPVGHAGPGEEHEIKVELPGVGRRILVVSSLPIPGVCGGANTALSIQDITEAKKLAQDMAAVTARVEEAQALRSRFLSAVNHDLRQPLQTICLIQGMLANRVSDPAARKLIERLDQAVASMSEVLDNLLDIDRQEAALADQISPVIARCAAEAKPVTVFPADGEGGDGAQRATSPTVFIVDDDRQVLEIMRDMVETHGYKVAAFADGSAFLDAYTADQTGCVITDAKMPGIGGLQMIERLYAKQSSLPVVIVTAYGDVAMAVNAMKAGAIDFLQKPVRQDELLNCIERALNLSAGTGGFSEKTAATKLRGLTPRQRQILDLVLAGAPTKTIAADLQLSQRTVDNHRAAIMRKLGAKSLPSLIRIALAGQAQGVKNAAMGLG